MSQEALLPELVSRFYRRVYYYFRSHRFSKEDARDLTQVVFVRLHVGMKDYRGGSEWAYIKKIADRVRLNEIRYRTARSRGSPTVSLEDLAQSPDQVDVKTSAGESAISPEEALLDRERDERREERSQLLRKAIEELPPRMKNCMTMRIYGGLKYREIAESLKVSLHTVKRLIYEAKKKLKKNLEDFDNPE